MKTIKTFTTCAVVGVLSALGALSVSGQVVFSDDMSGAFGTNWTSATTAASGTASFNGGVLLLDNGNTANTTWAHTPTTAFATPYEEVLTNNLNVVQWGINMRTLTTNPSNSNRMAFVLAASSSDFDAASGYAVRVGGDSPSTDPFQLVHFTGGVNGTITGIASGESFTVNQFGSVRVDYNPTTDAWSLYGLTGSDAAAGWVAPATLSTQLGSTTVNSTGVNSALNFAGVWSTHTTAASQDRSFDNVSVVVVPEPSSMCLAALGMLGLLLRRRA